MMGEDDVKTRINDAIRPIVKTGDVFVFRRTPMAASLKEVVFAVKVKRDADIGESMVNALMSLGNAGDINFPEKIEFAESTLDFNDGLEHEYFMVKATLWSGD
ncbi:hypothetical protein [Sulfuricurvum sp.]|uniref:hypothetical protein n=1 Tax=Sulfuricurvum sp. TaxID=2025608 RepID=UPI002E35BD18|nr:hypothetical protein [Sulfuricurvum sp.]HEX5330793.1 hypothetical protein [Sulfuricurvum sp.]